MAQVKMQRKRGRPSRASKLAQDTLRELGLLSEQRNPEPDELASFLRATLAAQRASAASSHEQPVESSHRWTDASLPYHPVNVDVALLDTETTLGAEVLRMKSAILQDVNISAHSKMLELSEKFFMQAETALFRRFAESETLQAHWSTTARVRKLCAAFFMLVIQGLLHKSLVAIKVGASMLGWKPLLFVSELAWDETPMRISVDGKAVISKLVQAIQYFHMLVQRADGLAVLISGQVPSALSVTC